MQNIQTVSSDCPICFTPSNKTKCVILSCECTCCQSCLTLWTILKIREFHFHFDRHIPCFNIKCQAKFNIQNVFLMVPQAFQEQINQELLSSYLVSTSDVRKCPNLNCSYAGIISISAKCSQPLKCEACQTTWRDPLHLTRKEKFIALFSHNKDQRNEAFSSLWKKLWTKRCPGCQVSIQKYGGCPSIRCGYCGLCFCWICHSPHNSFRHFFNVVVLYIFSIIGGLFSLYGAYQLVLMLPPAVYLIKTVYSWSLKFLGWCLCLLITNIFLIYGIFLYEKARKYPDRWRFCWEEVVLLSSVCCACTYYLELYTQLIIIALVEIPAALVIYFLKEKGIILQKTD